VEKKEKLEKQEFKPKSNNGGTQINRSENQNKKINNRITNNNNNSNNSEKDNTVNKRIDETTTLQNQP